MLNHTAFRTTLQAAGAALSKEFPNGRVRAGSGINVGEGEGAEFKPGIRVK